MQNESRAIESLIQVLSSDDSSHRCYAAQALGRMRCSQAVSALVERLRDEDIDVCLDAAIALGDIGSESGVLGLLESFNNDPSGEVRSIIAEALNKISSKESVEALLSAVKERDPNIEMGADWDYWWDVQSHSVAALGRIGDPKAIPIIEAALDDIEGQDLSVEAFLALASLGDPGIEALMSRLEDPNLTPILRRRAVEALLEKGGPEVDSPFWPRVMALLNDQDPDLREALIEHLNQAGENSRLDPMVIADDPDAQVRVVAVRIMGRLGESRFINKLTALSQDPDADVRQESLRALAAQDIKSVEPWLVIGLKDPVAKVAAQAALGLKKSAVGAEAVELLSEILHGSQYNQAVRAATAEALGAIQGDDGVVSTLGSVLGDPSQPVRIAAITALAQIGGPESLEILLAALQLKVENSSETGVTKTESSKPVVDVALDQPPEPLEEVEPQSTLEAIALDNQRVEQMDGENSPDLSETLERRAEEDEEMAPFVGIVKGHFEVGERLLSRARGVVPHQDLRLFAARVLGGLKGEPAVIQGLIALLADEDQALRVEALNSLGRLNADEAAEEVIGHLDSTQMPERLAAVQALGAMSGPGVATALLAKLDEGDPYLDNEVVRGLANFLHDPTVESRMIALIKSPEPTLRLIAAEALTSRGVVSALSALEEMAYLDQGNQRREVGRLIGRLDRDRGLDRFVEILNDSSRNNERRVAIEVLGEILSQEEKLNTVAA